MSLVKRFEDLKAWQEARTLTKMIYEVTKSGDFSKDFGLRNQIQRATVSVMANIAEGFDCDSKVEFSHYLVIARRSASEVQSLLYTALDNGYISQDIFEKFYSQANITKALIGGLKKSISKNK